MSIMVLLEMKIFRVSTINAVFQCSNLVSDLSYTLEMPLQITTLSLIPYIASKRYTDLNRLMHILSIN